MVTPAARNSAARCAKSLDGGTHQADDFLPPNRQEGGICMPTRRCITTPDAPPPIGPYCQGNIAGPFVFTAEEGPEKPDGTLPKTIEEQTDQVINNIEAIL